jgi:hypothetical protein
MTFRRAALLLAILVLAALAGRWVLAKRAAPTDDRPPAAGATPTVTCSSTALRSSPTPILHRLAGVAQGKVEYAAVEGPDGVSRLYRVGEDIPDLGRLVRVDAGSATVEGPAGQVRLRVAPAPTPSVTPSRRPTSPPPLSLVTPTPRPPRSSRTVSGSSPSSGRGRSAS